MVKKFLLTLSLCLLALSITDAKQIDKKMAKVNIFKDIFISIDRDLNINTKDIYLSEKYKKLNIRKIETQGSLEAIDNLRKSKANIAIVRGDTLGVKKNAMLGLDSYEDYGIICSPSRSILYLVSKKEINSINDIRGMEMSTGLSSNMAQLYLNNVSKNSGVSLDIGYNSINIDESIEALKKGQVDAIFMFATEEYASIFTKNSLIVRSLPDDFFDNLTIKEGLNSHSYELNGKKIKTLEVPNFIIAPKTTLDANINLKVESMVSAFGCYQNIQNIDSFYGELHPDVKEAYTKIHERLDTEDAITFSLVKKVNTEDGYSYIYDVKNSSSTDMNITLDEFRTSKFDKVPMRPRHFLTVTPSGIITVEKESKKSITFSYRNPFLYHVDKTKVKTIYKNLTIEGSKIVFFLTLGDKK